MQIDTAYNVVFSASWADYEEDGWIVICEKDGQYFYQEGGHSVMDECLDPPEWNPDQISQNEALELMIEWAEWEEGMPDGISKELF